MKNTVITLLVLLVSVGSLAITPRRKISRLIGDSTQSIGTFSNGCTVDTGAFPLSTIGYQAMRIGQRRYFGRLDLV